ncbi:MAG: hypothetical protein AAGJ46_19645, partial [Planctomycetota bacterium]
MTKIIVERCSRISSSSRGWIEGQMLGGEGAVNGDPMAALPPAKGFSGNSPNAFASSPPRKGEGLGE